MTSIDLAGRKRARLPSVQDGVDPANNPSLQPISFSSHGSPAALRGSTRGQSQSPPLNFGGSPFPAGRIDQAGSTSPTSQQGFAQVPPTSTPQGAGSSGSRRGTPSASFRNVSACNRCRVRKNRCDQQLPRCQACEKVGAKCVGYDPFLGKEIPRSYVYFLESRTLYLEKLLQENGIQYTPADDLGIGSGPEVDRIKNEDDQDLRLTTSEGQSKTSKGQHDQSSSQRSLEDHEKKVEKLASDIGMVSVHPAPRVRLPSSTSSISFARVVLSAVRSTISRPSSKSGSRRSSKAGTGPEGASTMRDSIFGLHAKPNVKPAPFPDESLGRKLMNLYFDHANPQIPTLHRGEFMGLFDRVYSPNHRRTARESYLLNIVYAIGAGIILDSSDKRDERKQENTEPTPQDSRPSAKKTRLASVQYHPEEYHASAIVHLENFLSSTSAGDRPDGYGGGLEELQAVLLLAGFALLRPVAPGLWYIVGVAVRVAVDLGLHYEAGGDIAMDEINSTQDQSVLPAAGAVDETEIGRRQWVRDLRRRLWWCTYSLDRLVSTVVGRPFAISDQVITTSFPSMKDDEFITTMGISDLVPMSAPSYKLIAQHYFRLRLLQSEIVQVLQYQSAQRAHKNKSSSTEVDPFMHNELPSPFLPNFITFGEWRKDMDRRLWVWKTQAPTRDQTGVAFNPQFLELNYWQAVILLYRQSVTTPEALAHEESTVKDGMDSPHAMDMIPEEDEDEDFVYLKIAEAGQKVLKIYRHLHRMHLVNYTYLATHHLFMAGISFLYAIWYSCTVRAHLTLDDVDSTVLATLSVLSDLTAVCPPAQSCRDAFDRMSRIVLHMAQTTTGFGPQAAAATTVPYGVAGPLSINTAQPQTSNNTTSGGAEQRYTFDMDLGELFANDQLSPQPTPQQPFYVPPQDSTQLPSSFSNQSELSFFDNFSFGAPDAVEGDRGSTAFDSSGDAMEGVAGGSGPDDLGSFHSWGILGIDGTHDWSEGSGNDFFGGFFFGGS